MKIVVCDDKPDQADLWHRRLARTFVDAGIPNASIERITRDRGGFDTVIETLYARRFATNPDTASEMAAEDLAPGLIDEADVLVVDFDLGHLGPQIDTTGARLAYLARCYSSCLFIVVLNQFGTNSFDLNLSGHVDSFADLDIGGEQIGNIGLWSHAPAPYRPWVWPVIPETIRARNRLVEEVAERLDEVALLSLGFDAPTLSMFSDQASELMGGRDRLRTITFREIVRDSPLGLDPGDSVAGDRAVARVAVARIAKWLAEGVLPRQDILVDAPHLVLRFPSLLAGSPSAHDAWMGTTSLETGIRRLGIRYGRLAPHHFKGWEWLGRHCWIWPNVATDSRIDEVMEPWSRVDSKWVFAEDSSRFIPIEDARRFISGMDTPFRLRYVERSSRAVDYHPASSFE